MAKDRYDYDEDYFLNGDSQFDGIFNNLKGMYQDYVHTDDEGRARIDHYITPQIGNIGSGDGFTGFDNLFQDSHEGMRGYIQAMGQELGIKDLDKRIVVFNDVDHEDTAFDKEQQEALRQEMYAGYQNMSDRDKDGCSRMLQQNRDETTLTLELYKEEQLQDAMDWEHTGGYANGKFDIQEGYAAGGVSINEFGEIIRENDATLAGQSFDDIPTFTVPEGMQDMSGMFADKHVDSESAFRESARSELHESRIRQAEGLANDVQEKVGTTTPPASRRLNDPQALAETQSDVKIAEKKDENKKDRFKETFDRFRDLFDKSRSDEADFSK